MMMDVCVSLKILHHSFVYRKFFVSIKSSIYLQFWLSWQQSRSGKMNTFLHTNPTCRFKLHDVQLQTNQCMFCKWHLLHLRFRKINTRPTRTMSISCQSEFLCDCIWHIKFYYAINTYVIKISQKCKKIVKRWFENKNSIYTYTQSKYNPLTMFLFTIRRFLVHTQRNWPYTQVNTRFYVRKQIKSVLHHV